MEAFQNAEIRQYLVDVCTFHTIFDDIEDALLKFPSRSKDLPNQSTVGSFVMKSVWENMPVHKILKITRSCIYKRLCISCLRCWIWYVLTHKGGSAVHSPVSVLHAPNESPSMTKPGSHPYSIRRLSPQIENHPWGNEGGPEQGVLLSPPMYKQWHFSSNFHR